MFQLLAGVPLSTGAVPCAVPTGIVPVESVDGASLGGRRAGGLRAGGFVPAAAVAVLATRPTG